MPSGYSHRVADDWPFSDPCNVATLTVRQVIEEEAPILFVTHDADDGSWQFLTGERPHEEDGRVVALQTILAIDPSIAYLADLPVGWRARRSRPGVSWSRCELVERHESPDGSLAFVVTRDDQVGLTLGFDGYAWHTHPEDIAIERELDDPEAAWREFVDELVTSRMPVAIYRMDGRVTDIALVCSETVDEFLSDPHWEPDETIEVRMWDGTPVGTSAPERG